MHAAAMQPDSCRMHSHIGRVLQGLLPLPDQSCMGKRASGLSAFLFALGKIAATQSSWLLALCVTHHSLPTTFARCGSLTQTFKHMSQVAMACWCSNKLRMCISSQPAEECRVHHRCRVTHK